jgi:hypothetical protein
LADGSVNPTYVINHQKWKTAKESLHGVLTMMISPILQDEIANFDGLEAVCGEVCPLHIYSVFKKVMCYQLNPALHPMLQINTMCGLYEKLKQQGATIPESLQAFMLLEALPQLWQNNLIMIVMNKAKVLDIKMDELTGFVVSHWETQRMATGKGMVHQANFGGANKLSSIKKKKGSKFNYSDQKGKGKAPGQGNSLPSTPSGGSSLNKNKHKHGKHGGQQQHTHFANVASHAPPTSHTIAMIGQLNNRPTLLQWIAVEKDCVPTSSQASFYPLFTAAMQQVESSS